MKDNICNVINFSSQCVCTSVYGYVSFHLFHWLQLILRKNVDNYYGFNTCNPNSFNQNTCRAMQFYSKYVYSSLSKKCFRFYQSAILSPEALYSRGFMQSILRATNLTNYGHLTSIPS